MVRGACIHRNISKMLLFYAQEHWMKGMCNYVFLDLEMFVLLLGLYIYIFWGVEFVLLIDLSIKILLTSLMVAFGTSIVVWKGQVDKWNEQRENGTFPGPL